MTFEANPQNTSSRTASKHVVVFFWQGHQHDIEVGPKVNVRGSKNHFNFQANIILDAW